MSQVVLASKTNVAFVSRELPSSPGWNQTGAGKLPCAYLAEDTAKRALCSWEMRPQRRIWGPDRIRLPFFTQHWWG